MKSPLDSKVIVNSKDKYAYWAFVYLLAFVIFSGYVEFRIIWHIAILVMALWLFIVYPKESRKLFDNKLILISIFLVVIMSCSSLLGGNIGNVLSNIRSMGYSLFSMFILAIIMNRNDVLAFDMLKSRIIFFNMVLIVNTIVVAIQAKGTGFMIKSSWLASNPYYDDQVAGLFGFNSTSQLGMYTIFVALLNMAYGKCEIKNRLKRNLFLFYTIALVGIMAILSKYNDNAGYYIVLLMYVGLYLSFDTFLLTRTSDKKMLKIVGYVFLVIIAIAFFMYFPPTKAVLDKFLRNRVEVMLHFQSSGMTGSNERLYQVQYGLSQPMCWLFGKGFGTAKLIQADAHGFLHFGISSMGGYIILLGVWFFMLYTLLYSKILTMLTVYKKGRKIIGILSFILMIIFSLYIPVYNDARSVILIGLYGIIFRYMAYEKEKANVHGQINYKLSRSVKAGNDSIHCC